MVISKHHQLTFNDKTSDIVMMRQGRGWNEKWLGHCWLHHTEKVVSQVRRSQKIGKTQPKIPIANRI